MPKDAEYAELAVKYMRDDTANRTLNLNIEYRIPGSPPAVTLTDPSKKEDLAKLLIADGVLLVENRRERRLHKLVSIFTGSYNAFSLQGSKIFIYMVIGYIFFLKRLFNRLLFWLIGFFAIYATGGSSKHCRHLNQELNCKN